MTAVQAERDGADGPGSDRLTRLRSDLARLAHAVADVEDSVASILTDIAKTASQPRAERLLGQAAEARDFAAKERAQADTYVRTLPVP